VEEGQAEQKDFDVVEEKVPGGQESQSVEEGARKVQVTPISSWWPHTVP